jgi:hypothetical protein
METSNPERTEGLDRLAKDIQRVQEEVQDASSWTPDHDQSTYARGLKDFKEKLQKARSAGAPKAKFSFKGGRKITASTPPAAAAAASSTSAVNDSDATAQSSSITTPSSTHSAYNTALRQPSDARLRTTSFSTAEAVLLDDHAYIHIITSGRVPSGGTSAITKLKHCIVNMSHPSACGPASSPNMNIRDVEDSLLVVARVKGATHVTNMRNSVLVLSTGQLRMHDCKDVDVYLSCASHPIIENCQRIRFAPLPEAYANFTAQQSSSSQTNQWDQVDDFNWLKQEPSPNWSVLPESGRVTQETWTNIVPGSEKYGLTDILNAVGVRDAEKGRSRRGSETCGGDGF